MLIDLRPLFRRLLLTAGLPMLSLSCGNEAGRCAAWGTNNITGGCKSGPYNSTVEAYFDLTNASAKQVALYEQCVIGESCPESLCLDLIDYKPIDATFGMGSFSHTESFGALVTCEPACMNDEHRGVHAVYTLSGGCTGRR